MFPKISIIKPLFDEDLSKDGLTASEYWLATSIETIKSITNEIILQKLSTEGQQNHQKFI